MHLSVASCTSFRLWVYNVVLTVVASLRNNFSFFETFQLWPAINKWFCASKADGKTIGGNSFFSFSLGRTSNAEQ
jgi:hypothetical protein